MNEVFVVPDIAIMAGCALLAGGSILVMPRLVQRLPWINPTKDDTDFVIRLQGTLFTLLSLLLAFSLVQSENYNRKVDAIVSGEASQLNRMDRLLARYGTEEATALRPHLVAYATSVVKDEWSVMLDGRGSGLTHGAWDPLSRGILALKPTDLREQSIFTELLRSLNQVVEARDERLSTAGTIRIPVNY
ncbi:hypothetical protein [Reyranella sp.]|uniref:bestrophin-like domain n=1 Tax=Reyranella sp. TaxID=1929291 RepID=UPI003D0DE5A3